jgi:hypothetical protein
MLRKKKLRISKLLRRKVMSKTIGVKAVTIPRRPPIMYLSEAAC